MPSFNIYEFSKKFTNPHEKNGIWVSGGFEIDKSQAFCSSNYKSGSVTDIPQEIRQAIIDGLFEIPNSHPPNLLTNEEFKIRVERGEIDINNPPLENVALIARELGHNYCVLAVATRQMDDQWRSRMVGYRYFWLKTLELDHKYPSSVDGIATLLTWWGKQRKCFAMNPKFYNHQLDQSSNYNGYTYTTLRYKETISQSPKIISTRQLKHPRIFESSTHRNMDCFQLHSQAVLLTQGDIAWAWNVRKLTKPETFTVIYCADPESAKQFSMLNVEVQDDSSNSDLKKGLAVISPKPISLDIPNYFLPLVEYLDFVSSNADSSYLRQLIEFYKKYPPEEYQDKWNIATHDKLQFLKDSDQERCESDIRYMILMSILTWHIDIYETKDKKSSDGNSFSEKDREWAIKYLEEISESIKEYQNIDKGSVSQIKKNIQSIKKTLSQEIKKTSSTKNSNGNNDNKFRLLVNFLINMFKTKNNVPFSSKIRMILFLFISLVIFFSYPSIIRPQKQSSKTDTTASLNNTSSTAENDKAQNSLVESSFNIEKLEQAKDFINNESVSTKCINSNLEPCEIYLKIKKMIPVWQELFPNYIIKKNDLNGEIIEYLQQGLIVSEKANITYRGHFLEETETAVKNFQSIRCGQTNDGQVGEMTWKCLSDYVQKQQVLAVIDYKIESLRQKKQANETQKHINQCKADKNRPKDFIDCITSN